MKILILKQCNQDISAPLQKIKDLCKSVGLNLELTIKDTTRNFTAVLLPAVSANQNYTNGYQISQSEILDEEKKYGNFDEVLLIYSWAKYPNKTLPPSENGYIMQIPIEWCGVNPFYPDVLIEYILHEMCHAMYYKFGGADETHNQYVSGKYQNLSHIDYYLMLLKQFNQPVNTVKYEFFSQKEVDTFKLKPELWQVLDKARKIANTPFIITSGYRIIEENIKAGGKPNSAHLRGLACDILVKDNLKRTQMIKGIVNCGTDVFLEDAVKHLHVDIDSSIHTLGQTLPSNDD